MRPRVFRLGYNMNSTKYSISALPLVPRSQLLINNLTPDAQTPSFYAFRTKVLTETPSLQRRARVYVIFIVISDSYTNSLRYRYSSYRVHAISLMYPHILCHFRTR